MKKSIIAIIVACVLVFVGVFIVIMANANKEEEVVVDLNEVYNSIIAMQPSDAEELILFEETNDDYIEELYTGLKDVKLKNKVIYVHPIGMACEIALVEVENKSDVDVVKNIFESRIGKGIDSIMCDSDSQDIWRRNAQIHSKGNYVCMIVLPDEYKIPENVFEL